MNKETTLREYIEFKRTSVKSEPKIRDIEHYTREFMNSQNKPINNFQERDLIQFINSLNSYKTRTANTIKAYIKNFIKWNFPEWSSRFRNLDKLCRTEKPEPAYQPEQMLSIEDIQKLVDEEDDLNWKAYFLTLFYGGFRPSELCNLKWTQISFESNGTCFIKIYSKKNKEYFNKFIPEDVTYWIKKIQNNNSVWVFPSPLSSRKNLPITQKGVYFRLKSLSERTFNKRINPYILRHSIATILYNKENSNDDDVARQLGHSKNMKKTYSNLSEEKIKERARKIYLNTEDLPPEKKHELELKIELITKKQEIQEKLITKLSKMYKEAIKREIKSHKY